MGLLDGNPITSIVDSVSGAVQGITKTIWGDASAKDAAEADQNKGTTAEFAAEFVNAPTNWWDSLVNGLNRLPRPIMVFSVLGLLAWCPIDPEGFTRTMGAYALVPMWLASAVGLIIAFYFGTRHREQMAKLGGPSAEQIAAYAEIKKLTAQPPASPAPMPDSEFKAAMASPAPMSNAAILEWNRRQGR